MEGVLIRARPGPGLVFAASTRFVGGNDFVWPEERFRGEFPTPRQIGGDGFHISFTKTHTTYGDGPVRLDQENCRHVGQAVGIGDGKGMRIEESEKRLAVLFVKVASGARSRCKKGNVN